MLAPLETWIGVAHEPQPGFVNERGGLKRLPWQLLRQAMCGQLAQLFVNKRKQLVRGVRITASDGA